MRVYIFILFIGLVAATVKASHNQEMLDAIQLFKKLDQTLKESTIQSPLSLPLQTWSVPQNQQKQPFDKFDQKQPFGLLWPGQEKLQEKDKKYFVEPWGIPEQYFNQSLQMPLQNQRLTALLNAFNITLPFTDSTLGPSSAESILFSSVLGRLPFADQVPASEQAQRVEQALLTLPFIGIPQESDKYGDPVVFKMDPAHRYQYLLGFVLDLWVKVSDLREAIAYDPDRDNRYLLYTRNNATQGTLLEEGHMARLVMSDFKARRRTVVLVHGWMGNADSIIYKLLVPAFLEAEDVNVITVDWGVGADTSKYVSAVLKTVTSGMGVARFLNWLLKVTGATASQLHIVGHSLGGHQAGIIARNVHGEVTYVTSLDPAGPGWIPFNAFKINPDDALYVEAIHTDVGATGYAYPVADVDFFPNEGYDMPGCEGPDRSLCNHFTSIFYFAESVVKGGFTGTKCESDLDALAGYCFSPQKLNLGGIKPKIGARGIYFLETNAAPPYSRG